MLNNISILILLLSVSILAQTDKLFDQLESAYQTSKYNKTIELSKVILQQNLTKEKFEIINEIRAVCFYSIGKKDSAKISFIDLLKSNEKYSPDPLFISPKIIAFFNSIKKDYKRILSKKKNEIKQAKIDSTKQRESRNKTIKTIALSTILPGTGQLTIGEQTKGIILLATSTALLGGAFFYTLETNRLESSYRNEANKLLIQTKYDAYNKSYKTRNILFTSYGLLWLFTQVDLLIFNQEKLFGKNVTLSTSLNNYQYPQLVVVLKYSF